MMFQLFVFNTQFCTIIPDFVENTQNCKRILNLGLIFVGNFNNIFVNTRKYWTILILI